MFVKDREKEPNAGCQHWKAEKFQNADFPKSESDQKTVKCRTNSEWNDCFYFAGFLGHVTRAGQALSPEVFKSVHLIEGYLDFLKVGDF